MSPRKPAKPKQTYPPDWSTFKWPDMTVLAFDQSLAHVGWALVRFQTTLNRPMVRLYGTVSTEPIVGLSGWRDSLARGDLLLDDIAGVMAVASEHSRIDRIVHEMPAMMGGSRSTKQEGPPISAMAVRAAARRHENPGIRSAEMVMVEIQRSKRMITGNHLADKPQIKIGLFKIIDEFSTNEHVRDACAVAITSVAQDVLTSKLASAIV